MTTFTYPDIIVVCGEPRFRPDAEQDTLHNPTLVFEILSPDTELIDRSQKLRHYLAMDSVLGYFLVSQHMPRIEAYTRR